MVKTKIICTLGPASSSPAVLRNMILSGMDIVRLNFSHGSHKDKIQIIKLVRQLNKKMGRHIKILGDLQGHRVRVGSLASPIELKKKQIVWLTKKRTGNDPASIPFDFKGPLKSIKKGHQIFIDDGNICLEVIGRTLDGIKTAVIVGGLLKSNKGINIPDAKLEFGCISAKDTDDIEFCKKNKVDYIAQSFVRTKDDILEVRSILGTKTNCKVIAKIENADGIKNIDGIIKTSDGIMIARGDMGVSLPVYKVPVIQKMIINKCNDAAKIVITATQMLESMTENKRPTRAEVSDVANAVIDGTDFVMLSGETAIGKYPAESVDIMNKTIQYTERYLSTSVF